MVKYYERELLEKARKQKRNALIALFAVIGVYLIFTVGIFFWYTTLPYQSPTITTVKLIHYPVTAVMVVFLVIFIQIKIRRVSKFLTKCIDIETGLTETSFGSFIEFSDKLQTKDGVDFKWVIFLEYNEKKKNFFERKVLVFYELDFPNLKEGDNVRYVTQGNVLKEYEIVEGEQE